MLRGSTCHIGALSIGVQERLVIAVGRGVPAADLLLARISQRRNSCASSCSGREVEDRVAHGVQHVEAVPFGPFGFCAWSVTLAMSGKSRLANHRMLSALLVQEICSAIHALLLLTIGPAEHVLEHASWKNLRAKSTARAVSAGIDDHGLAVGLDLVPAIGPQQRIEPAVVVAEAVAELEAERVSLGLQLLAGLVEARPRCRGIS